MPSATSNRSRLGHFDTREARNGTFTAPPISRRPRSKPAPRNCEPTAMPVLLLARVERITCRGSLKICSAGGRSPGGRPVVAVRPPSPSATSDPAGEAPPESRA